MLKYTYIFISQYNCLRHGWKFCNIVNFLFVYVLTVLFYCVVISMQHQSMTCTRCSHIAVWKILMHSTGTVSLFRDFNFNLWSVEHKLSIFAVKSECEIHIPSFDSFGIPYSKYHCNTIQKSIKWVPYENSINKHMCSRLGLVRSRWFLGVIQPKYSNILKILKPSLIWGCNVICSSVTVRWI